MNGISKKYKVKDSNELLEIQIPHSSLFPSLFFFLTIKCFFYFESHGESLLD